MNEDAIRRILQKAAADKEKVADNRQRADDQANEFANRLTDTHERMHQLAIVGGKLAKSLEPSGVHLKFKEQIYRPADKSTRMPAQNPSLTIVVSTVSDQTSRETEKLTILYEFDPARETYDMIAKPVVSGVRKDRLPLAKLSDDEFQSQIAEALEKVQSLF